jgi:hypothetical protein
MVFAVNLMCARAGRADDPPRALVNKASGVVLDVPLDQIQREGIPLHQWEWNCGDNQRWRFVPTGGGRFAIRNEKSGKVIAVANLGKGGNGEAIVQWSWTAGANHEWQEMPVGDGWFWLKNCHSGKALSLVREKNIARNGAAMVQWDYAGDPTQLWRWDTHGGQKFGYGRFRPRPDTVVLKIPGTPGFWAPRSRDNWNNVPNWDSAIARKHLGQYPDGSVCQLMLSGHGDAGGVGSEDGKMVLNFATLTEDHAKVIRAKLNQYAWVVLMGCETARSEDCMKLAKKLERRVVAFTGTVMGGPDIPGLRSVGANRAEDWYMFDPLPANASVLARGAVLRAGESRTSPNGQFRLTMQGNGNLVLSQGGKPVWASNTDGVKDAYCTMQPDGNLVVYGNRGGRPGAVWASNTYHRSRHGNAWVELFVHDDGNLVLYHAGLAIWDRHGRAKQSWLPGE